MGKDRKLETVQVTREKKEALREWRVGKTIQQNGWGNTRGERLQQEKGDREKKGSKEGRRINQNYIYIDFHIYIYGNLLLFKLILKLK